MDGSKNIRVKDGLVTATAVAAPSGGNTLIYAHRESGLESNPGASPTSNPQTYQFTITVDEDSTLYINTVFTYTLNSDSDMTQTTGSKVRHKVINNGVEYVSIYPAYQGNICSVFGDVPSNVPANINQFDSVTVSAGEVVIEVEMYEDFYDGYANTQVIVGLATDDTTMREIRFCSYVPWTESFASIVGSWGDFNDHPGNCHHLGDFITFFGDGSGIEYNFLLLDADGFNTGFLGIVGQQYGNGAPADMQLEINGFSYPLSADDAPSESLPLFPTGDIGTGPWQYRHYNTADIVADAPWVVGSNTLRITAPSLNSVGISGRLEFEAVVFGDPNGTCLVRDSPDEVCFTCPLGCDPIFRFET